MNMPMGEGSGKISAMIANIRAGLDELEATVAGEEPQEEPMEGEESTEESAPEGEPMPEMTKKPPKMSGALGRFSGM